MAEYTRAITITWHGLDQLRAELDPHGVRRALEDGIGDVAVDVTKRAKENAPVATARLARSIRLFGRMSGPTRIIVAGNSQVRYAAAVHEGTGEHGPKNAKYVIKPKNKRVLFFPSQRITTERFGPRAKLSFRKTGRLSNRSRRRYGNAAYVMTRIVHHPGVRARPFLKRAMDESPANEILAHALAQYWRSKGAR